MNTEIETLRQAGMALYGDRWVTDMAKALELSTPVRIHQWLKGDRPIPATIWPKLNGLITQRMHTLQVVSHTVMTLKSPT